MKSNKPRMNIKSAEGPFALFVKERRMEMEITQKQLADLTGLSLAFIRSVEQGYVTIQLAKLMELVTALGGMIKVERRFPKLRASTQSHGGK